MYGGSTVGNFEMLKRIHVREGDSVRSWPTLLVHRTYMLCPPPQDKHNGYDAIYRQHVIKPALVGLAGPWISGGVEFNWCGRVPAALACLPPCGSRLGASFTAGEAGCLVSLYVLRPAATARSRRPCTCAWLRHASMPTLARRWL